MVKAYLTEPSSEDLSLAVVVVRHHRISLRQILKPCTETLGPQITSLQPSRWRTGPAKQGKLIKLRIGLSFFKRFKRNVTKIHVVVTLNK